MRDLFDRVSRGLWVPWRWRGWGAAIVLLLWAVSASAQTPEQIVGRARAKFGATVSPAEAPTLLRAIAVDLTQTLGTPYGLLPKSAGNQCGGYACDIICNAGFHWDVFEDAPDATIGYAGAAKPHWNADGPVPRACELVAASVPAPPSVQPPPLTPNPVQAFDFAAAFERAYQQNERMFAFANDKRDEQTATLKAAIDSPAWYGRLARFLGTNPVAIAAETGLITFFTTHQVMK